MLILLLISLVAAQSANAFSPHSITAAVLMLIVGLAMALFGLRLLRPMLAIAGFAVFSMVGYIALIRFEPANGYSYRESVLLFSALAIGLVGALLAVFIFKIGIALLGALGGSAIAVFVLSFKSGGVIQSDFGRGIFIALLALIGAGLCQILEKPAVIILTSFAGSFLFFMGIDIFAKTGLVTAVKLFLAGDAKIDVPAFDANAGTYGMLVGVVFMFIAALVFQYSQSRPKKMVHHDDKQHRVTEEI